MSKRKKHDYFEPGDRIYDALDALHSVKSSFVGDTVQAHALILALCDQAGASIEAQRCVAAVLSIPEETLPRALKNTAQKES